MNKVIPLSIPNFEGNEKKYVEDAVSKAWVSTGGAYVSTLEKQLADFLNVDNVAACQSGTSALHLSLIDCMINPRDIIIVPTLTFIAAVNPVRYLYANPVFMDCDDTLCMDPLKIKEFCETQCEFIENKLIHKNTGKQVKAIIVVHIFGNMADMESIMNIADKYNIKVIEDATEALGTYYTEGRYIHKFAGTIGDYGAYSFNGNKIITTGGGGAVTAKEGKIVDHLRYLSTQAKDDPHYYIHNEIGYNYRMTNVQAAIGVAQMELLSDFINRKNKNYQLYKEYFKDYTLAKLLPFRSNVYSNKWFYSLEIDKTKVHCSMRELITILQEKGIQTRAIWGLIHEQHPYINEIAYKIEKAVHYSSCILNIPCSTQITENEIAYVSQIIKDTLNELTSYN